MTFNLQRSTFNLAIQAEPAGQELRQLGREAAAGEDFLAAGGFCGGKGFDRDVRSEGHDGSCSSGLAQRWQIETGALQVDNDDAAGAFGEAIQSALLGGGHDDRTSQRASGARDLAGEEQVFGDQKPTGGHAKCFRVGQCGIQHGVRWKWTCFQPASVFCQMRVSIAAVETGAPEPSSFWTRRI